MFVALSVDMPALLIYAVVLARGVELRHLAHLHRTVTGFWAVAQTLPLPGTAKYITHKLNIVLVENNIF